MQVRSDIFTVFIAHENMVQKILRISGESGTFFKFITAAKTIKPSSSNCLLVARQHFSTRGQKMLEGMDHLGLVCKRKIAPHRLRVRFATQQDLQVKSTVLRTSRHWDTGNCMAFLSQPVYKERLIYFITEVGKFMLLSTPTTNDRSLSFLAAMRGKDEPLQFKSSQDHAVHLRFKAINGVAKKLVANQKCSSPDSHGHRRSRTLQGQHAWETTACFSRYAYPAQASG